jgi:hypothetical protein
LLDPGDAWNIEGMKRNAWRALSERVPAAVRAGGLALLLAACGEQSTSSNSAAGGALPPDPGAQSDGSATQASDPTAPGTDASVDLSSLASWCPGCLTANGGDTTDFGGGVGFGNCWLDRTVQMSIEDARALGVDVSDWQFSPTHIDVPIIWHEQQRRSQLSVDIEIESLLVSERLSLDGGPPDPSCGPAASVWLANTRVIFASDDGSIAGTVELPAGPPSLNRHPVDLKLELVPLSFAEVAWPPVQKIDLHGNLPLAVEPGRVPQQVQFSFFWYRMDPSVGDRISIEFLAYYDPTGAGSCPGPTCSFGVLATAWPVDGCLPWELPRGGACVSLDPPPLPPPPGDAGTDAEPVAPAPSDAGP